MNDTKYGIDMLFTSEDTKTKYGPCSCWDLKFNGLCRPVRKQNVLKDIEIVLLPR